MPLDFPIDNQSKGTIEQTKFNELNALKFKGGLPIFTAVPTYSGVNGEMVFVKVGSNPNETYDLYGYIKNSAASPSFGWQKIGSVDLSAYELLANKDTTTTLGTSDTKYPSQNAVKTYVDNIRVFKSGYSSRDLSAVSGDQTIAHGLGKAPALVVLLGLYPTAAGGMSFGCYTSSGNNMVGLDVGGSGQWYSNSFAIVFQTTVDNRQTGAISVDSTNITITWTRTGYPPGTVYFLWFAF